MSPHDSREVHAEADARGAAASEANNVPGAAGWCSEIPSYLDADNVRRQRHVASWESGIDLLSF